MKACACDFLYKHLVDESLSFDENKRKILRFRGFRVASDLKRLDEIHDYNNTAPLFIRKPTCEDDRICEERRYKADEILNISTYEEFLYLFDHESAIQQSVCFAKAEYRLWSSYASRGTEDVEPDKLEGFVARLVRVLNHVGCYTDYSCDGWHHQKRKNCLFVGFTDRYSMAWFKTILKYHIHTDCAFKEGYSRLPNSYIIRVDLPPDDSRRIGKYLEVNRVAAEIEGHEQSLLLKREETVNSIAAGGINMDELSIDEVEDLI